MKYTDQTKKREKNADRPGLLLVDDEDGIRAMLSLLLEDMGYAVTSAASAPEALAVYRRLRPDIVMTDIKMPGMSGIELLQAVKAENNDAEVIMLTGHGDMELAVSSLRHGAGDFLNKPVSEEALLVSLERARERMSMRAALRRHTRELETLVRERTRDLIRSERFAAVGESAAALAHSIKNIAGALEGAMFVLEKGLELNKREYFEQGWRMIRSDLGRLHTLTLNMLDMGRSAPLVFAPEVPGKPAREVLELLAPKAREAGVELGLEDGAGDRAFPMAAEAVHQCLLNLVLNGIEALAGSRAGMRRPEDRIPAPDKDRPGPATEGNEAGRVLLIISRERGRDGRERLRYLVRDNGPGFDREIGPYPAKNREQERGESPFPVPEWPQDEAFGSGKKGGSGIGIFATRKLAHDMGAELAFRPAPTRGTDAELLLLTPQSSSV